MSGRTDPESNVKVRLREWLAYALPLLESNVDLQSKALFRQTLFQYALLLFVFHFWRVVSKLEPLEQLRPTCVSNVSAKSHFMGTCHSS